MTSIKGSGLRIGELAKLAATTPRAVRHYHRLGLLAEPERDESGYRRYGPQHPVGLVRIRRLRSVGMPLDSIAADVGSQSPDVDIASAPGSRRRHDGKAPRGASLAGAVAMHAPRTGTPGLTAGMRAVAIPTVAHAPLEGLPPGDGARQDPLGTWSAYSCGDAGCAFRPSVLMPTALAP
jgi:DNA-binding transcriptional MerR regulator